MKVKLLSRDPSNYLREKTTDVPKIPRNYDPSLHPLEGPREYVRALNAAKLEKVFSKPFLGALSGHADGIYRLCSHPKVLRRVASGACDGVVKLWDLASMSCSATINAHSGFVRGVCFSAAEGVSSLMISVGDDKAIKTWNIDSDVIDKAVAMVMSKTVLLSVDHHRSASQFATSGELVEVWDQSRVDPVRSFEWGVDSIQCVKYNPIETNLIATAASDRSVTLFDVRMASPLRKVVMTMKANSLCWNPMESMNFVTANDDTNLYTFDMRMLEAPLNVHMDHVGAVMDVDFAPTGQEFVSGSFDKTVRIFRYNSGRSREVYHTKRMQRVFSVLWCRDGSYVLSGSDEMNIRMWKAEAALKCGPQVPREKAALRYSSQLREKFKHHPKIRRILRHRHVPKLVYKETRLRQVMLDSRRRKFENVVRHSKPGTVKCIPERQKHVVEVKE